MANWLPIALIAVIIAVFAFQVSPLGLSGSVIANQDLPELIIVSAEVSTKTPVIGGQHTLNILINNTGIKTAKFGPDDPVLYVTSNREKDVILITGKKLIVKAPDGTLLRDGEIRPGDAIFMKLKWSPIRDGPQNIDFLIDPTDIIKERNDTNNFFRIRTNSFTDEIFCSQDADLKYKHFYGLEGNSLKLVDIKDDNSTSIAINTAVTNVRGGETVEVGAYAIKVLEVLPDKRTVKINVVHCPSSGDKFILPEIEKDTGEITVNQQILEIDETIGEVATGSGQIFNPGAANDEEE